MSQRNTAKFMGTDLARLSSISLPDDGDLTWLPAWRIRELVQSRECSPVEVVEHFLERIEKLQPRLHGFRTLDAEGARRQAKLAEAAVMRGDTLGPLHGVPVAIKQILAIKGLPWVDMGRDVGIAVRDSVEVERLRSAGAMIIGATVAGLTAREFGDSDRMPLNPWDTDRVCGDSSSGSACVASSAMVPLAIGGDGAGSTRAPAAFCGQIGLHPTRGRVPSFEWSTLQSRPKTTYGPIARDVRDAATVMSVLAGPDGRDMMCLQDDPPDYLALIDRDVAGMRLAWTGDFGYGKKFYVSETPEVIDTVYRTAARLRDIGVVLEPTDKPFEPPFWAGNRWTASDVAVNSDYLVGFEPPTRDEIALARDIRRSIWTMFRAITASNDFIITPTTLEIAPTRWEWRDNGITEDFSGPFLAMTAVANLLGWPALTVPAGFVNGMPVGLQIIGRPDSEPKMFQLAQAIIAVQQ